MDSLPILSGIRMMMVFNYEEIYKEMVIINFIIMMVIFGKKESNED